MTPRPEKRAKADFNDRAPARKNGLSRKPAANDNDGGDFGKMPRWNLADLFTGLEGADLAAEKAAIEALMDDFAAEYEGTINWLSGADLGAAIEAYEEIERRRHRIDCFITLLESDDVANFAKTGDLKAWYQATGDKTAFFEYEIAEMKEADLMAKMSAPALAAYAPWIASLRADSKYPLPDDVSHVSADFDAASRAGWVRLYHETVADLKVDFRGEKKTIDEVLEDIGGAEAAERAAARKLLGAALREKSRRVALIYNTILQDDRIDADLRGHARPDQAVNLQNGADDEIVDTMFKTIKSAYARQSHRFYAWKARQHGLDVLPREKLGMDIPGLEGADSAYDFDDGRRIVLRAFRKFSPKFARLAEKIFKAGHIDAAPRPGKEGGAFALPTGPGGVPYIMLNYDGSVDSVAAALGHELGHGIHQLLSEKACGHFLSAVPTPVAETASIFAEMLVFEELLKQEKDPAVRKRLMADRVENMIGNGLQQLSYYDFEKRVHKARRDGELDAEQISDIWVATQKEYYGPAVELDDLDRYYWMTVPHFFDTPFYVYSYAFAQQVVSGLYQLYRAAEAEGPAAREEFIADYIGLLETGMTKNLYEMFQPFGLDPETPAFWEKGLSLADKYLDDLVKADASPAPAAKSGKPARKPPPPGAA